MIRIMIVMMMIIYSCLDDNNDEKLQHLRLSNNNTSFEKENDPNTITNFVRNYKSNTKTIINAIKEKLDTNNNDNIERMDRF